MARPTKFKKKYNKILLDYFDIPPNYEFLEQKMAKNGEIYTKKALKPNKLPTFSEFAFEIGVSRDSLHEWAKPENEKKYEGFSDTYKRAKGLQKNFLIQNGLLGLYPSNFAIFVATRITDMRRNPPVMEVTESIKWEGIKYEEEVN